MFNAEIRTGVSQKTGKEYMLIEIELVPNYKKVVFLDNAEVALIKATQNNE